MFKKTSPTAKYRKQFSLINDVEFLTWFQNQTAKGYLPPLYSVMDIQELITRTVDWYQGKYVYQENMTFSEDEASKGVNLESFYARSDECEKTLMDCSYRMAEEVGDGDLKIAIKDLKRNMRVHIVIDGKTGFVKKGDANILKAFFGKEDPVALIDIYTLLKEDSNYDITSLRTVLLHHLIDVKLRKRVFENIVKILAFDDRFDSRSSYELAEEFVKDVEKKYGLLMLNVDIILRTVSIESTSSLDPVKSFVLHKKIDRDLVKNDLGA